MSRTIKTQPVSAQPHGEAPAAASFYALHPQGFQVLFTVRPVDPDRLLLEVNRQVEDCLADGFMPLSDARFRNHSEQATVSETKRVPLCAVHGSAMDWTVNSKGVGFWSCHKRNDDGSWCKYQPKQN